jgi:hypothetical protein
LEHAFAVGKEGDRPVDRLGMVVVRAVDVDEAIEAVESAAKSMAWVVEPEPPLGVSLDGDGISLPVKRPHIIVFHELFGGQAVEKTSLCPMFETVRTGLVGEEHGTASGPRRLGSAGGQLLVKLHCDNGLGELSNGGSSQAHSHRQVQAC